MANGRRWSAADIKTVFDSYLAGKSAATLATEFGRTEGAVFHLIYRRLSQGGETRQSAKVTTMRPCLSCKIEFASEGNHNRRCDSCKRNDDYMPGGRISHTVGGRTHRWPAVPHMVFMPVNPPSWPSST